MFVATFMHSTMGKGAARRWRALWLAWVVVAWAAQPSLAQRLIWLGTLPGGSESAATGVSADGSMVVGWAYNAAGQTRAFRWTAAGGMQDFGTLGSSWAFGVSADGSVVVGSAQNAAGKWRAFRWTAARGMQDLGTLGGGESEAHGVSADGSVVVGTAHNAAGYARAFRWTASGGMEDLNVTYASLLTDGSVLVEAYAISPDGRYIVGQGYNVATGRFQAFLLDTQGTGVEEWLTWLGTLGGNRSEALGVSADGSVVVGWAINAAGYEHAFRWTAARGMQDLGTLPGAYQSEAHGVSADGSVVVGRSLIAAFRWTAARGMEYLGTLGGWGSAAYGVSADGSVVVGMAENAAGYHHAFRWTAARGMQDLGTLGGRWSEAYGVSADGSVVVGSAQNAAGKWRAFRWTAARGMQDLGK
jgi:probable HAF family extracellular repeat protein